jgi:hypothetical protein
LLELSSGLGVKPREPMIAPDLSGIPPALIEAIRRRSRRGRA